MTTESQQVKQSPLFAQPDLRNILIAAKRILQLSGAATPPARRPCPAELQLLSLCLVIVEVIRGEFGEDLNGEPVGDLELRQQPYIPAVYRPKLRTGDNGK